MNSPVIVIESFTCVSIRDIFFVRFLNQEARIRPYTLLVHAFAL